MKHNVEHISEVEKKITVEIPKEKIREEIENTYALLKDRAEVKGFRRGKIPRNILEIHFKDQVESDVLSKLISDSYSKVLDDNKLNPVAQPDLDAQKLDVTKDYTYKATVEVKPNISIESYKGLELSKNLIEVTDKDVENVLEHLKETQSILKLKNVETLKDGDFAVVEIRVFQNGKQITPDNRKTHTVEMGKKMLNPKIEEALLKLKKGEETTVTVSIEEGEGDKKSPQKESEFKIKLVEVREKEAPLINDEFARSLGPHKDLKDLKDQIKAEITDQREKQSHMKLENDAMKILEDKNQFTVPKSLVEHEMEHMIQDFRRETARRGLGAKSTEEQEQKMKEEFKLEATKRVKQSLILEAIAQKEKIEASEQDIGKYIEKFSRNSGAKIEQVRDYFSQRGNLENLKSQIAAERTLDFIIKNANIKAESPKIQT